MNRIRPSRNDADASASSPAGVIVVESGPRDGLQSVDLVLPAAERVALVERLIACGMTRIEIASFVHPGRVPQMAEAEAIVAGVPPRPGVSRIGLVLNARGLDRALETTVDEIGFVVAASDGYNRSNQGVTVEETMGALESLIPTARRDGRFVSVTISVAFGCPYDGPVRPDRVLELAERTAAWGADEISLGDTIGVAVPGEVVSMLGRLKERLPGVALRCHFHDTRGVALANAFAAIGAGVRTLDTAVGGLGGSPFAPGAGGNLASEDLIHALRRSSIPTGVDLDSLIAVGRSLGVRLGRDLPAALQRVEPWDHPVAT